MSLIGEATIDSPVLAETFDALPSLVLDVEEVRTLDAEDLRLLGWATDADFDELEAALARDATVAEFDCLTDLGEERLYRVSLTPGATAHSTYRVAARNDVVIVDLTLTAGGTRVLARLPSRDALVAFADACNETGVSFRVERLYEEKAAARDGGERQQFGLTEAQRTVLQCALQMGYFDVPRETTLAEVAAELGVSRQALSMRLRRAQRNLLERVVSPPDG